MKDYLVYLKFVRIAIRLPDVERAFLLRLLLLVVILCASCTAYIFYPIEVPPQIQTDGQFQKVAFINKFDYTNLPYDNDKKKEVFTEGARQLIKALANSFEADENFSFVILDTLLKGRALTNFSEILEKEYVTTLCISNDADFLLVLESFDAYFSTETTTKEYEDGSKSHTNYVDLIVEAGFSLYQNTGDLQDRVMATESEFYQSRPALIRFFVIGPSMRKAGKKVNILAGKVGSNYINNFYPGSEMVRNIIYIGKDFSEVTPFMMNHQWDRAVKLLLPLAHSPDPRLAKKAAHNLAIAYDAMGNTEAFDYWILKSAK